MTKTDILLDLKWWFILYGRLIVPLSIIISIIGWRWFGSVGIIFSITLDLAILKLSVRRYNYNRIMEMFEMMAWARYNWREAEHWKCLGLDEMKRHMDNEVAATMIDIGRKFGYENWEYFILIGKEMDGVLVDETTDEN